jgi:hypothetical protein
VSGGTLTLATGGAIASNNLTVASAAVANINGTLPATAVVTANGNTNFGGTTGNVAVTTQLASLAIGGNTTVSIVHSMYAFTPTILRSNSTTYADGTSLMDISNNAFITNGSAAGALSQILSGQIFSSETADLNKAIGYIDLSGGDAGKFEVRYTLKGDTNVDGKVDVGDLGALATSYGITGGMSWSNGDFTQDGNVDVGDLGALATNYGTQLSTSLLSDGASAAAPMAIAAGGSAAVPEPTSLGLLAVGAAGLMTRRRRQA